MISLQIASLTLATLTGTVLPPAGRTSHTIAADSDSVVSLDATQLANYMATKKALTLFFDAPKNTELKKKAEVTRRTFTFRVENQTLMFGAYDYPSLVKQSPELRTIFVTNDFAPEQYAPTQKAVITALGALTLADANIADPNKTPRNAKNIALVKPQKATLEALGMWVKLAGTGRSGFGTAGNKNDDDDNE